MLKSIGDIALELGEPVPRIRHVLESRRIDPVQTAGGVRLYDDAAVQAVAAALPTLRPPHAGRRTLRELETAGSA